MLSQAAYTSHDFTQYKEIFIQIMAGGLNVTAVIGGSYVNTANNTTFVAALSSTQAIIGNVFINGKQITDATGQILGR